MPQLAGGCRLDLLARKWHALAPRRLLAYGGLYRSGRWRHYYITREQFAARMHDVIKAAKTWAAFPGEQPAVKDRQDDLRSAA
ncbi:MAG: hypothetical protein P8Y53_13560 [Pseudolabrys sp.]|jgi:hypothetical protein